MQQWDLGNKILNESSTVFSAVQLWIPTFWDMTLRQGQLQTFRRNVFTLIFKCSYTFRTLKMRPPCRLETSEPDYLMMQRIIPDARKPQMSTDFQNTSLLFTSVTGRKWFIIPWRANSSQFKLATKLFYFYRPPWCAHGTTECRTCSHVRFLKLQCQSHYPCLHSDAITLRYKQKEALKQ